MPAPPHSLHVLLVRWCWQMLATPHSLHLLLSRWCWQMLAPPHSLHLLPTAPLALVRADAALACRTFCCRPRCHGPAPCVCHPPLACPRLRSPRACARKISLLGSPAHTTIHGSRALDCPGKSRHRAAYGH